jgi:hypothetical protein
MTVKLNGKRRKKSHAVRSMDCIKACKFVDAL